MKLTPLMSDILRLGFLSTAAPRKKLPFNKYSVNEKYGPLDFQFLPPFT